MRTFDSHKHTDQTKIVKMSAHDAQRICHRYLSGLEWTEVFFDFPPGGGGGAIAFNLDILAQNLATLTSEIKKMYPSSSTKIQIRPRQSFRELHRLFYNQSSSYHWAQFKVNYKHTHGSGSILVGKPGVKLGCS